MILKMALKTVSACFVIFLNAESLLSQGYTTTQTPCNYLSYNYYYNVYSTAHLDCSYQCCGSYTYRYCCYAYTSYYTYYSYITYTLSAAAIGGIVIGVLFAVAIVISIVVCIVCAVRKRPGHGGVVYQNNTPAVAVVHSPAQQGVTYPTQSYMVSPQNYPYQSTPAPAYQPPTGVAPPYQPPYQPQGGVTNIAYTADQGSTSDNKATAPPPYERQGQYDTLSNQRTEENTYDELQ